MIGLDPRLLGDEPIWLKPFKFAVSFAVLFGTYAIVAGRLSKAWRRGWVPPLVAISSGLACLGELAYMAAQAARQEHSHFNDSTPYHEMMYGLMELGPTILMIGIAGRI